MAHPTKYEYNTGAPELDGDPPPVKSERRTVRARHQNEEDVEDEDGADSRSGGGAGNRRHTSHMKAKEGRASNKERIGRERRHRRDDASGSETSENEHSGRRRGGEVERERPSDAKTRRSERDERRRHDKDDRGNYGRDRDDRGDRYDRYQNRPPRSRYEASRSAESGSECEERPRARREKEYDRENRRSRYRDQDDRYPQRDDRGRDRDDRGRDRDYRYRHREDRGRDREDRGRDREDRDRERDDHYPDRDDRDRERGGRDRERGDRYRGRNDRYRDRDDQERHDRNRSSRYQDEVPTARFGTGPETGGESGWSTENNNDRGGSNGGRNKDAWGNVERWSDPDARDKGNDKNRSWGAAEGDSWAADSRQWNHTGWNTGGNNDYRAGGDDDYRAGGKDNYRRNDNSWNAAGGGRGGDHNRPWETGRYDEGAMTGVYGGDPARPKNMDVDMMLRGIEVNWDGEKLVNFIRDFYIEHPSIASMTPKQIDDIRKDNRITIVKGSAPNPVISFDLAGFPESIVTALNARFPKPTPIQVQGWPIALKGLNMIGIAETGSGKTLGFLLPALIHVMAQPPLTPGRDGPIVLILSPTRELAQQIEKEARSYLDAHGQKIVALYGGMGNRVFDQVDKLREGAAFVVACPGRLSDILNRGYSNLKRVTYFVLDEADHLLREGWATTILEISRLVRPDRQTLMWSATWPPEVRDLASQVFRDTPIHINIGSQEIHAVDANEYRFIDCRPYMDAKMRVIKPFLDENFDKRIMIFCNTKRACDQLEEMISQTCPELCAGVLHGDKTQPDRDKMLQGFRQGVVNVLIGTNVLSRGLDISGVYAVVNFDMPTTQEEFVHRVGRTGRAGAKGLAISLCSADSHGMILSEIKKALESSNIEIPEDLQRMCEGSGGYRGGYSGGYGGGSGNGGGYGSNNSGGGYGSNNSGGGYGNTSGAVWGDNSGWDHRNADTSAQGWNGDNTNNSDWNGDNTNNSGWNNSNRTGWGGDDNGGWNSNDNQTKFLGGEYSNNNNGGRDDGSMVARESHGVPPMGTVGSPANEAEASTAADDGANSGGW